MEVVLDTSFIVSCVRKRIDFLTQLEELGFRVKVPKEVMQELKDLKLKKGQSHEVRIVIDAVLEMFEHRKVGKLGLGKKRVDDGLIEKGKEGVYIATLDKAVQRQVDNIVIIRGGKGISIERK